MSQPNETTHTTLFNHTARPQWGLAILAWEDRDKRRYQFQDGGLRTFKRGYYEKLEPVTDLDGDAREILRDLKSMLRASQHLRASAEGGGKEGAEVRVDDQVERFVSAFPGGFGDAGYRAEVRGEGAARRKKRHRDPAIAEAREKLSAAALDGCVESGDYGTGRDALANVIRGTDLVAAKDVKTVAELDEGSAEPVVRALHAVLHGDGAFARRFEAWVKALRDALGKHPSWQLATTPLALVHPDEHICVNPPVLRRQAKRLAPDLRYRAKPDGSTYERFRTMASVLTTRLTQAEMPPRDMVDVYEFMWATMR